MSAESESDGRMSIEQKIHLIEYMEDHNNFASGKYLGVEGKITYNSMWEVLAEQLNNLGPRKSAAKWRRAWFDLKTKTKKKAAKFKSLRGKTGGGSPPRPLTDLDEKLISIISEVAVYGLETEGDVVLESGEPFQQSSVEPIPSTPQQLPTEPTPSTSKATPAATMIVLDHDYCPSGDNNASTIITDEEPGPSRQSTPCSNISSISERSRNTTPLSQRTRNRIVMRGEEAVNYFKASEKKFDDKVDTVISLLKENNENIKETNKLLRELINVMNKK